MQKKEMQGGIGLIGDGEGEYGRIGTGLFAISGKADLATCRTACPFLSHNLWALLMETSLKYRGKGRGVMDFVIQPRSGIVRVVDFALVGNLLFFVCRAKRDKSGCRGRLK